jgi:hypothetical protein
MTANLASAAPCFSFAAERDEIVEQVLDRGADAESRGRCGERRHLQQLDERDGRGVVPGHADEARGDVNGQAAAVRRRGHVSA